MAHHIKKQYTNGTVTVTWEPEKCIHCGMCKKGLPDVFKPQERPWIQLGDINSETIVEQVKKCPSSALGYYYNE